MIGYLLPVFKNGRPAGFLLALLIKSISKALFSAACCALPPTPSPNPSLYPHTRQGVFYWGGGVGYMAPRVAPGALSPCFGKLPLRWASLFAFAARCSLGLRRRTALYSLFHSLPIKTVPRLSLASLARALHLPLSLPKGLCLRVMRRPCLDLQAGGASIRQLSRGGGRFFREIKIPQKRPLVICKRLFLPALRERAQKGLRLLRTLAKKYSVRKVLRYVLPAQLSDQPR